MYLYIVSRGTVAAALDNPDRTWISQLRKGLVELLVLAALRQQEVYGYQLLQRLASLDGLALTESTLYPVLARLAADRLVAVRQVPSPAGPPRRYYRLTPAGAKRLEDMLAHWRQVNASINALANAPTRSDLSLGDSP
jgi:PadR family transcriptional regulator, regulatory protein PadR